MPQGLGEKKSRTVHEQVSEVEKARLPQQVKQKSEGFLKMIVYYSLPLISIGLFSAVLIFGTIPSVKNIVAKMSEIKEKNEQIQTLNKQIAALVDLQGKESRLDSDIAIIDRIVPSEKTQVAKFVGEIEELAAQYSLEESSQKSGEQIENLEEKIEEETKTETAAIIHIPTSSEYVSSFDNISDFLNALYEKDDFIIVKTLNLQGYEAREYFASKQEQLGEEVYIDTSLKDQDWTIEVTFEKYQFSEGFGQYIAENFVDITNEPDESTMEFIRAKYGK
jgi:hypothetical protein